MHFHLVWYPYLGQNVHSLKHSLHLPLLLSCKLVQQWFQMAGLHNQSTIL